MGFIDEKYNEFVNSKDFKEIGKNNREVQQLIKKLHIKINEFGIPAYPIFRKKDRSSSKLKVFNMKIQYPVQRDDWNNVATIKPYGTMIEVFTFKNGEPQESYFIKADNIDVCLYKDGTVTIEQLLNEIKEIYKIRTNDDFNNTAKNVIPNN